jgi:hypothetical protein
VKTASNQTVKSEGTGQVKIGNLLIDNVVHVPKFSHNLLSGIQLMKMGLKQIIFNDKLTVLDGDKVVCTGHFNHEYGLIEMDTTPIIANHVSSVLDLTKWHNKLGHVGTQMIKRTLDSNQIKFKNNYHPCDSCLRSKSVSKSVSRFKGTPDQKYDKLEMIESDTTPFPTLSYDGYVYNVKYVCRKTGFIHMCWLKDLKSATVLESFMKFRVKFENITGKRIKYFRSDGGTEYKNVFENYLISNGIIKQVGDAHRKHFPARAERAHRTILNLAKSNHISSKLPLSFYSDAHRYSTYIINRMVRFKDTESPFSKIFKKDANLKLIVPFGCICYVQIPKAKRKLGKLDDASIRCRFLGFGNHENEDVQNQGYKLLRESDRKIVYSSDVVFLEDEQITPLGKIEDYGSFYESLVNVINVAERNDQATKESEDIEDLDDHESNLEDLNVSRLNQAIAQGHVETRKVMLCRDLDIPMKDLDDDIFACFNASMQENCPQNYQQAVESPESCEWIKAMEKEMDSINAAETWLKHGT